MDNGQLIGNCKNLIYETVMTWYCIWVNCCMKASKFSIWKM